MTTQIKSVESNVADGKLLRSWIKSEKRLKMEQVEKAVGSYSAMAMGGRLTRVKSRLQDSNSVVL